MTHSLFFDLLTSNELAASVSIRPATPDTWLYEITETHPPRIYRGTLSWHGTSHLDLVRSVLADYLPLPTEEAQHPRT